MTPDRPAPPDVSHPPAGEATLADPSPAAAGEATLADVSHPATGEATRADPSHPAAGEATLADPSHAAARHAWRLMRSLVTEQHDTKTRVCEALGMSFVRVKALGLLAAGPRTLRELAATLACDPPYATVITADLAARGLVRREPNPADGRSRLVTLTDSGHLAAAEADRILGTPPPELLALPAADLATLDRILTRVASGSGTPSGTRETAADHA
ncbi:DNA-binding MarR family transcriptional regulator [Actinoplanes octamycinicus]|uniref:DNA-binding MarR family transcriptional regulator n=1 Tax=Actinoplanes octamycinicus TaxID=135948 RepID=A0A7W7M8L0_9ACTN|nr:MarR family transcriptional regulator [Actinoplanes octamycinicus]MBB4741048.1 DNA-binding MarR family transcriptional regulator [Actinoplanes octamycinicus]GIE55953.1 hypothetical protein Aoc01nite_13550 [Actinoplanes octamycinicus]